MTETLSPPWNFSWVVDGKLSAMGWPQTEANVTYLLQQGVTHLVTLSPEMVPPTGVSSKLQWTLIPVQEFEAPTLDQIKQFISICEQAGEVHKMKNLFIRPTDKPFKEYNNCKTLDKLHSTEKLSTFQIRWY